MENTVYSQFWVNMLLMIDYYGCVNDEIATSRCRSKKVRGKASTPSPEGERSCLPEALGPSIITKPRGATMTDMLHVLSSCRMG